MKNVLIVEDNKDIRKRLCRLVESVSPEVSVLEFENTKDVYETVFKKTIDIFIIDIILDSSVPGDVSGLKLVEDIRKIPRYEFTPVIFVTSLWDEALYAYSKLHSYMYIEKPFDDEQIKNVIAGALRFPGLEREDKVLHFRMDGTFFAIKSDEVLYIESHRHKLKVHRVDGKSMDMPYKTMDALLLEADRSDLVQCNRAVIVNKKYIEYIDWSNSCLKIRNVDEPFRMGEIHKRRIKRIRNDI